MSRQKGDIFASNFAYGYWWSGAVRGAYAYKSRALQYSFEAATADYCESRHSCSLR
jgi:hypothetical protein